MESEGDRSSARVLVVEDNKVQQEVMRILLEKFGITYRIVSSARAALAALAEDQFDLVLMDWRLPEMDGIACTHAIRDFDKRCGKRTAIVAVTATDEDGRRDCIEGGMDDFLSKPFTVEQFQETVARWLPQ